MLKAKLFAGGGAETIYVDDVFSAYTYTGTGAAGNTITNGIDLSTNGGMVWVKARSSVYNNVVADTARGAVATLSTNLTTAEQTGTGTKDIYSFDTTGFKVGTDFNYNCNTSAVTYASWTFRKAPKFFDVVTWTGNGANRTIAHSLGSVPGMIVVKLTSSTSNWHVYHQSIANTEYLLLNTTAAKATDATLWNSSTATSSVFSLGTNASVNQSGQTYVAYLFAHDTGTDGLIQCGSIALDGSGKGTATLGWEAQYILTKNTSATEDWRVFDASRGFTVAGQVDAALYPNLSSAEYAGNSQVYPTATGFGIDALTPSNTYVYMAIRRPNKPPTVGTQVYNGALNNPTTGAGFLPDLFIACSTAGSVGNSKVSDRLRGSTAQLTSSTTAAEANFFGATALFSTVMTGVSTSGKISGASDVEWFFKRAPGVFDQVCYTGTGVAKTEAHNLGVVPELVIIKSRSLGTENWWVDVGAGVNELILNGTNAYIVVQHVTSRSATTFGVDTHSGVNTNTATYVAYLFATKTGISKVGSYTGTATTNQIDCGFTTGARFVLIKRTDSTGDWYVWDTVRGIIAGNDPYLLLNSTAAEVTSTDYIDSYTSGFELSSTAPAAINASGGTYIYLAFS